MIIIMKMFCYKIGKSIMMAASYKSDDDNKSNNNKNKV